MDNNRPQKAKISYEEFELEFLKLHLEFMNTFNLLDTNLTLCIGFLLTGGAPSLAYPLVTKLSVHGKMQYLKDAINSDLFEDQTEMVEKFNSWLTLAQKAKGQRNDYVHGRWRINRSNRDLRVCFEPQFWTKAKTEMFSMEEFRTIVSQMLNILEKFHVLRKKYLDRYECAQRVKQIKDCGESHTDSHTNGKRRGQQY